ncbi:hypothetical protein POG14_05150 [Clostridium paraputrificum]|uniref:hypothetical protein n=1 Tax=Clostridium paraputrificum TaxID=29363 RepID=UPI00189BD95E|nr:hypothetical protein [Clostridium paraputrificum]MDC0801562.1 hypothetical protein [Clostridium paraputrificum]
MADIKIEYPEGAAQGAMQVSNGIRIELDDNSKRTVFILEDNLAINVADSILHALGELTSEELKDRILSLESRIEELEGDIAQYDENLDAYKEKLIMSTGPF